MKSKPYRFPLYLLLRLAMIVTACFPRAWMLGCARMAGAVVFVLLRKEREKTIAHLQKAYGAEKNEQELHTLAHSVFKNLAETGADWLQWSKLRNVPRSRWVDYERSDIQRIFDLLGEGRGVIVLTGHLGNWELLSAFLFSFKEITGAAVGRRIYYEPFNQTLVNLRLSWKAQVIYRDESAKRVLKLLKSNQCLGILPDQDVDSLDGIFVPFFGRPAYTTTSPVRLALSSGAPIVPAFLVRERGRYRFFSEPEIRVEQRASREEMLRYYTAAWSSVVEKQIRRYPDQWVWMHNRWKTQETVSVEPLAMAKEA